MAHQIPGEPGQVQLDDADLSDEQRTLIEWAEGDIRPDFTHPSSLHGAEAAASGRALMEAALGGPEALTRALGGRPHLDPAARPGTRSPVRNVRLPQQMSEQLDRLAQAQGRNASDVIRDALTSYLTTHA
jgi:Ribbon-helix-helix protein, copG family